MISVAYVRSTSRADRHLHRLESRPQESLRGRILHADRKFHSVRADQTGTARDEDPRPSIEERYPTKETYVAKVRQEAAALVTQRLLLPADSARLIHEAETDGIRRGP